MAFLGALGGGFGLRNTFIGFAVLNILIVAFAAVINNFFPTVPFASIITAYTNLFLTMILLFVASTVGFAEIIVNVMFQILWAVFSFLWTLVVSDDIPSFLLESPSFSFKALTDVFVGLFQSILQRPLLFSPPASNTVALAVGGATTTAILTQTTN